MDVYNSILIINIAKVCHTCTYIVIFAVYLELEWCLSTIPDGRLVANWNLPLQLLMELHF